MTTIPYITVQLVHIQGPLKGEIQELADSEIRVGRHPDCQVRFAKDEVTLSRVHARILREGNRFKLVDQSTNGTYVNGVRVPEAYLKDGDVIMFAEGGPKVSFLTQTGTTPPVVESPAAPPASPRPPRPHPEPPASSPPFRSSTTVPSPLEPSAAPHAPQAPQPQPNQVVETVKVPFAIQYGPALKSFHTLPIVLGKGPGCDFVINHPNVMDRHAQIFFAQDRYRIKDLTGSAMILLNEQPMPGEGALTPDMVVTLTRQGPRFRFLGGGRMAEIEAPTPETAPAEAGPSAPEDRSSGKDPGPAKKPGGLFKKFFS